MEHKSALIFGSTGLVGSYLVEELLKDPVYSTIKLFVRKRIGYNNSRIEEFIIDFQNLDKHKELIQGSDVYICLGTTIKKAGSVENMDRVDHLLPMSIAKIALSNGSKKLAVVSSIGASKNSRNYYLSIKGKMEEDILSLDYQAIAILRPSLLVGNRKEKRVSETISKYMMKAIGPLFFGKMRKYRAIQGKTVARAMIKILNEKSGKAIFESDMVQELGM